MDFVELWLHARLLTAACSQAFPFTSWAGYCLASADRQTLKSRTAAPRSNQACLKSESQAVRPPPGHGIRESNPTP